MIQRQSSDDSQNNEGAASVQRLFIGKCRHSLVCKMSPPGKRFALLSHLGKQFSVATSKLKENLTKVPLGMQSKQNIYFNLTDSVVID